MAENLVALMVDMKAVLMVAQMDHTRVDKRAVLKAAKKVVKMVVSLVACSAATMAVPMVEKWDGYLVE